MKSLQRQEKEKKDLKQTILRYKGKRISLFSMLFEDDNGSLFSSEIVKHPGAVALLPINENGDILLIRQWRRAISEILLEIPAGTLEPLEIPVDCATRELQEEVGLKPKTLIPLGGFYTSPGFCNEYIHLFLAKNLIINPLNAEDSDGIDVLTISLEEALSWAYEGKICDSKTLSALCLYQLWLSHSKRNLKCAP